MPTTTVLTFERAMTRPESHDLWVIDSVIRANFRVISSFGILRLLSVYEESSL